MPHTFLPEYTENALEKIKLELTPAIKENELYLAGGTGLAFHIPYRISVDLDFFTSKEFDPRTLANSITQGFGSNGLTTQPGTVQGIYNECHLSFFHYPYTLVEPLAEIEGMPIASVLDIALMKVTAIADRALKKDFYDLYFAAKHLDGLENILTKFVLKYPDGNLLHHLKSLVYFADATNSPDPVFLIDDVPTWSDITDYFEKETKSFIQRFRLDV